MVLDEIRQTRPKAKAIFLAQSIQLVIQQAERLSLHCHPVGGRPIKIDAFGSFNSPTRPLPELLHVYDVLVFTPQTLLNLLKEHGDDLSGTHLLVFDEVHHNDKRHPFHELLQDYYLRIAPGQSRPHLLGVTASMGGSMVEGQTLSRLKDFEERTKARIFSWLQLSLTCRAELDQFKSRVNIVKVPVPVDPLEDWFARKAAHLKISLEIMLGRGGHDDKGHNLTKQERKLVDQFANMLTESLRVAEDCNVAAALGWLAGQFMSAVHLRMHPSPNDNGVRECDAGLLQDIQNKFMTSGLFTDLKQQNWSERSGMVDSLGCAMESPTAKQRALVDQLSMLLDKSCEDPQGAQKQPAFCCIVFLKTRLGVKKTMQLLTGQYPFAKDWPKLQALLAALTPRSLVGCGSRDLSETVATQMETLRSFREGQCNLLVATSVAEEGLDFPECNTVIRMDGVESDIALAQSRGRVRADGHFVLLFKERDTEDTQVIQAEIKEQNFRRALEELAGSRPALQMHEELIFLTKRPLDHEYDAMDTSESDARSLIEHRLVSLESPSPHTESSCPELPNVQISYDSTQVKEFSKRQPTEWTVDDVCELFAHCGFVKYRQQIQEYGVDGKTLTSLSESELITPAEEGGLGMHKIQVRRIQAEIHAQSHGQVVMP